MESVLLLLSDLHTTSTETLKGLLGGGQRTPEQNGGFHSSPAVWPGALSHRALHPTALPLQPGHVPNPAGRP